MRSLFITLGALCCCAYGTGYTADTHHQHHGHQHDQAPIGVMGEHIHAEGEWMLSYRYMNMNMDGNRDGNDRLSTQQVFDAGFAISPTEMTMEMHMLGAMYAPSDALTLMLMIPYLDMEMDHRTAMGGAFTTRSDGVGDVQLSGLYQIRQWDSGRIHLNLGLSLPTGSIDEQDDTPAGPDQHLPYPMQLGSGTYDLLPGITYVGERDEWSWGTQGIATLRLGENDNDYTLGDRLALTGWVVRKLSSRLSGSLRLKGDWWGNVDGEDKKLPPMMKNMVPTADPDRRGGRRIDLLVGINSEFHDGGLGGHRFALEAGAPVHQDLDGPQLETDWTVTGGWQYVF